MKLNRFILLLDLLLVSAVTYAQSFTFGWEGTYIIPKNDFTDQSKWIVGSSEGESCVAVTDTGSVNLHWKFGSGNRSKYIVCFQILQNPVSLGNSDLIGIDVKGSVCNSNRNFSLKFEDGTNQAVFTWHGLASLSRWCEKLSILRSQFGGSVSWNNIKVISLVVSSDASPSDVLSDSGTVSVKNLQISDINQWTRATEFEHPDDTALLRSVKDKALQGILSRQASNGLFCTWNEDNSSWLYGQGLVLKILSLEGIWENKIPSNDYASAAEKLAIFLVNNQKTAGYWPRAWNTSSGSIKTEDPTVWMGDFPWIITGLVNYYARSGDDRVLPAIVKARAFLYSLIKPDGEFYTLNTLTSSTEPVTSVEAYCAGINSVFELGDTAKAMLMLDYISGQTWDNDLLYWKEGIYSTRPVLFGNTWMAMLMYHRNDSLKATDALSFTGKALYTHGPGRPGGLDGIGPVATWYEGSFSYITAGGPGSGVLYDSLIKYRFSDGTVPAYNDTIGGKVDIWAVNWSSLDATSWLYFASAGKSPFVQYYHPLLPALSDEKTELTDITVFPVPARQKIYFTVRDISDPVRSLTLYDLKGSCLIKTKPVLANDLLSLDISSCPDGLYLLVIELGSRKIFKKIEILR